MESSLHHVSPVKGHDTDQAAVIQTTVNRRTLQTLSRQLIVGFTHDDKTSETQRQYKEQESRAAARKPRDAAAEHCFRFKVRHAAARHVTCIEVREVEF